MRFRLIYDVRSDRETPDISRYRIRSDSGSVTIEGALVLCALTALLAAVLVGFGAVLVQFRCADAAQQAARLIARNQVELAEQAVSDVVSARAELTIQRQGDEVHAYVQVPYAGFHLRAGASAIHEAPIVDVR